ncbi:conserved hypothetical protein [Sulfolobus islandicus M.14.25]|uniref:Uncharacterized protein n=2 Tax=Saccharolobus islandicus TaxID=43080 RepID=C3MUX7_SACI4|nr:conserved hypothetical protein [Sulfolobus islandicus M.14.25]
MPFINLHFHFSLTMRKSLLALLTLSLALLMLATPAGAISASQLGAQQIYYTLVNANWAGVGYSVYNSSTGAFNKMYSLSETVYLGNASFLYIPNSLNENVIGFRLALSSFKGKESFCTI